MVDTPKETPGEGQHILSSRILEKGGHEGSLQVLMELPSGMTLLTRHSSPAALYIPWMPAWDEEGVECIEGLHTIVEGEYNVASCRV